MKIALTKIAALTCMSVACATGAMAQDNYPNKPIRWVVATAAGGGNDVLARTLAEHMSKQLGQQIVIENKPGGANIIAAEYVLGQPADGYTLLSADNGTLVNNVALFKKLSYQPEKDFSPIGLAAKFPLVLATHPKSGLNSIDDVLKIAKEKPAFLSAGSSGIGSPHHLALEMFKHHNKLDITHIPYKGGALSTQDTVSGQIPLVVIDLATANPMIKAGKLLPLASFSQDRIQDLAQVPTLIERKLADKEAFAWVSVVAKHGTPEAVVAKLNQQLRDAINQPAINQKLVEMGYIPMPSTPQEMQAHWKSESDYWIQFIKQQGIKLD